MKLYKVADEHSFEKERYVSLCVCVCVCVCEPFPVAMQVPSPKHWTTREFLMLANSIPKKDGRLNSHIIPFPFRESAKIIIKKHKNIFM